MSFLSFLILVSQSAAADSNVEKVIVYKKETTVNLEGVSVDGDLKLPPAFFIAEQETQTPASLLEERLQEPLRNQGRMFFY